MIPWTRRALLLANLGVVLVLGACSETEEARTARVEAAPMEGCAAILLSSQADVGDVEAGREADSAAKRAARSMEGTANPDVVAIRSYIEHDEGARDALAQTGDLGVLEPGAGHRLLVDAAQACDRLGAPELREYLYEVTGAEEYAG